MLLIEQSRSKERWWNLSMLAHPHGIIVGVQSTPAGIGRTITSPSRNTLNVNESLPKGLIVSDLGPSTRVPSPERGSGPHESRVPGIVGAVSWICDPRWTQCRPIPRRRMYYNYWQNKPCSRNTVNNIYPGWNAMAFTGHTWSSPLTVFR